MVVFRIFEYFSNYFGLLWCWTESPLEWSWGSSWNLCPSRSFRRPGCSSAPALAGSQSHLRWSTAACLCCSGKEQPCWRCPSELEEETGLSSMSALLWNSLWSYPRSLLFGLSAAADSMNLSDRNRYWCHQRSPFACFQSSSTPFAWRRIADTGLSAVWDRTRARKSGFLLWGTWRRG